MAVGQDRKKEEAIKFLRKHFCLFFVMKGEEWGVIVWQMDYL